MNPSDENWQYNYFNYFTEVEEHFRRARGTGLFLLSTLDWALVEMWKDAGVPLEAVIRGIDQAFEKWRSRKSRIRMINSLAYCAQAVMDEAQAMAGAAPGKPVREAAAPFSLEELRAYLEGNAAALRAAPESPYEPVAAAIERILADLESHYLDLEELEQRLSALEDKMVGIARARQTEEDLFQIRRELDAQLRPYRGKMTAEQLAMLEKQYLDRGIMERAGLPRLSLFYMR
ncbi:MAG: hypothetical protein KIT09_19315 [Bryobacteraceae bacterium]|nr:hypothetical protein [Bryobacteraceae bacterium]